MKTETKASRADYYIASGEGERGKIEIAPNLTLIGIKRILTRERCDGDRWAYAALASDCNGDYGYGRVITGPHNCDVGTIKYFAIDY